MTLSAVQGTMRKVASGTGAECWALTAPFGTKRANMTLSYSCGYYPGGDNRTHPSWSQDRVLWAGPAGYSSMDSKRTSNFPLLGIARPVSERLLVITASRDGNTYFMLYERGEKSAYETLHLTQVLAPQWKSDDDEVLSVNSPRLITPPKPA